MIITKLHIENFGKLHDVDMNFSSEINQIYKENGWGKSSLSIFIKAMLYGMPPKARGDAFNYERSRFTPWQGGLYGGFLQIKTENTEYKITRFFGKTPESDSLEILDLTNNQKLQDINKEIGEILFGVGRESFEVTSFFSQLKFTSSANSQITANLTGVDKFQNDLSNFNQAIKIIDVKTNSFKKEKPKKEEIENLRRYVSENKTLIEIDNKKLSSYKKEFYELEIKKNEMDSSIEFEKGRFIEQQNLFDRKLKMEEKLRENSAKMNELLSIKNQFLEKNQQIEKANKTKKNYKIINILSIATPIFFVLFMSIFAYLTIIEQLKVFIGVIISFILVVFGVVVEILLLKKRKKCNINKSVEQDGKSDDLDRIELVNSQIKDLQDTINQLNEDYKVYYKYSSPDREILENIEDKLHATNIEIINKRNQIENVEREIDELIEKNDKMVSDYNFLKEKFNEVDEKIKTLTLTKDCMLQARENVSKRFIVPINQSLKNLLIEFEITDRNYVIDTEWNVKEETNFGTKEFQYSSQGLQDIISFCQRINLIEEIYKKEKPVIILDDTFVNLDDKKLSVAKRIVKEISKTYQVIYICCNEKNLIVE